MNWFTGITTFLTIWWIVLFAVLPIGVRSYAEMGIEPPRGCDPGSPVDPKLLRKAITTSWVTVIVFLIVWAVITFHVITLPELNHGHWFR